MSCLIAKPLRDVARDLDRCVELDTAAQVPSHVVVAAQGRLRGNPRTGSLRVVDFPPFRFSAPRRLYVQGFFDG